MLFYPKNWLFCIAFFFPGFLIAMEAAPDTAFFDLRETFCNNQIILVGNQLFGPDRPEGEVVLQAAAADGSDSIITVQLTFLQRPETTIQQQLCAGDTLYVNGTPYHANFYLGEEVVVGGAANGCDSLIHIALTFSPLITIYQATICEGDTIYINQTAYHAFHPSGEEFIPNGSTTGCDSIIQVQLEVLTPPFSQIQDTLCPDEFIMANGRRYDISNRAGLEILEGAASTGCDSLVTVALIFQESGLYLGDDQTVVKGDSVCVQPALNFTPVNITWSPAPPCDLPDCISFCFQPLQSTRFVLHATDAYGCILTDQININVSSDNRVYAPTVFSPDAAWPNNRFFLSADRGTNRILRLFVVDRWGELMYDRSDFFPDDPDQGWDGTFRGSIAPVATYTFYAELERIDGTTFVKTGTVTLLR